MAWYAKFDGVDGSSESRSAPNVSEIVVTKDTDIASGMGAVSWGLDRIDQRAPAGAASAGEFPYQLSMWRGSCDDAGIVQFAFSDGSVRHVDMPDADPFFAYGDGAEPVGAKYQLQIMYIPLGEPDPVGDLAVADAEANGFVLHAGYILG
jgi:hypothetical protein